MRLLQFLRIAEVTTRPIVALHLSKVKGYMDKAPVKKAEQMAAWKKVEKLIMENATDQIIYNVNRVHRLAHDVTCCYVMWHVAKRYC